MPGNVPNTSRDSFQFSKMYDSVVLQQGVPIPDSDWNELQDIRRMMDILEAIYVLGEDMQIIPDGGTFPGFYPVGAGLTNDFNISAGVMLVGGVLAMTTMDEPPAAITYDDASQQNYIAEGVVETFAGSLLTESTKNWQAFHDLLATANHGACRVRFTSGTESGNEYTITAYTATSLTISGGSPSPGDTYVVLPPELTTPGGARTDEIYIMAWWEDIASEEDSVLEHPGLGVETAHRARRRWCVRVAENGTTPVTTSDHGFGVRYLQIGTMVRSASATIGVGQVGGDPSLIVPTYKDHVQVERAHGLLGNYTTEVVDDSGSPTGGIGTGLTTFEDVFDAVDAALIRRRAFTAVLTQPANSDGGDFSGPNVVDDIDSFTGGIFMLRRGQYEWSSVTTLTEQQIHVLGERWTGDDNVVGMPRVAIPAAAAANFRLTGIWEKVHLESLHASFQYQFDDSYWVVLRDFALTAGAAIVRGARIEMRNGRVEAFSNTPTDDYGLRFDDLGGVPPRGIVENVDFKGPGTGAGTKEAALGLVDIAITTEHTDPLVFRNCHIEGQNGGRALYVYNVRGLPVVFENCHFRVEGDGDTCVEIRRSYGVTFRNCTFYAEYGKVLDNISGVTFEDCVFRSGDTIPSVTPQMIAAEAADIGIGEETPLVFRDCEAFIGASNIDIAGTLPIIELNGQAGAIAPTSYESSVIVDGFRATYVGGSALHRYTTMVLWGPNENRARCIYRNVTLDVDGRGAAADRGASGVLGRAAHIELAGDISGSTPPLVAENIQLIGCDNPAGGVADDGGLVIMRRSIVRGLLVSAGPISGTGTSGDGASLIELVQDCELYDLDLFRGASSLVIDTDSGDGVISVQSNSHMRGGVIHNVDATNANLDAIIKLGSQCTIDGLTFTAYPHADEVLIDNAIGLDSRVTNCHFYPGALRTATREFLMGIQSAFVGNTYKANRNVALTVDAGSRARALVDSNVVLSTNTTAPTITASGTGAVTGDNVLAANAT